MVGRSSWQRGEEDTSEDVSQEAPTEGKSYADVLGETRQKAKPDSVIKGFRKIRAVDLLVEFTTELEVDNAVKSVVGDAIEVKIFASKANSRGQKMTILTLSARYVVKLLAEDDNKIVWLSGVAYANSSRPSGIINSWVLLRSQSLQWSRQEQYLL
ncbi:hypothetical protein J6590_086798 [Homalodisca vitripennis]|nr:hypothetical protein J6590_086798 [Homalodisca vitripennis]